MDLIKGLKWDLSAHALKKLADNLDAQRRQLLRDAAVAEEREKMRRERKKYKSFRKTKPGELAAINRQLRNLRILRMAWRGFTDAQIAEQENLSRSWVNVIVRREIKRSARHGYQLALDRRAGYRDPRDEQLE